MMCINADCSNHSKDDSWECKYDPDIKDDECTSYTYIPKW